MKQKITITIVIPLMEYFSLKIQIVYPFILCEVNRCSSVNQCLGSVILKRMTLEIGSYVFGLHM